MNIQVDTRFIELLKAMTENGDLTNVNADEVISKNDTTVTAPNPYQSKKRINAKKRHDRPKGLNGAADPIRNDEDIEKAKLYFLNRNSQDRYHNTMENYRDYMLFVIGCNTARRIGDILQFTFGTFMNGNREFKDRFEIKEQKTGKHISLIINDNIKEAIELYIDHKYGEDFKHIPLSTHLFMTRQSEKDNIPMTRQTAHNIYKKMANAIGLTDKGIRISCHSPRKTWAYKVLTAEGSNAETVTTVQKLLNHSSSQATLAYCGITQDKTDEVMKNGI